MSQTALTVKEAAKELRLGVDATYTAIREGKIPSLKFGRRIIVPRAALQRILENAGAPQASAERTR